MYVHMYVNCHNVLQNSIQTVYRKVQVYMYVCVCVTSLCRHTHMGYFVYNRT